MIYFFFISLILFIIFIIFYSRLIKITPFDKIKKTIFKSLFVGIFFFSFGIVSITYYFLGSPHLSNSELIKIKLEKKKLLIQNIENIKNAKQKVNILKKMLIKQPNNIGILLSIASNASIIQDINTEIKSLEKILSIKPLPKIQSLLAQAYLKKDNGIVNFKLKKLVDKILILEPKDPAANYILGIYLV